MAQAIELLRDRARRLVPEELSRIFPDAALDEFINEGLQSLEYWKPKASTLTWAVDATSVTLPTDLIHIDKIICDDGDFLDSYFQHGGYLYFHDPTGASIAGGASIYYWAYYPEINGTQDSELPPIGDTALVQYCAYKMFRRVATSRSDYRKYAVLMGGNGADISVLEAQADIFFRDFEDAKRKLEILKPPTLYYGGN